MVAKAEQLTPTTTEGAGKQNPRLVATSLPVAALDARTLYETLSCARGDMENRRKEQQLMLVADRTRAATLRANQRRLDVSSIASVLVQALRRLALAETALARAPVHPIRLTLLTIGARVRVTTRKVWLALASGCPHAVGASAPWGHERPARRVHGDPPTSSPGLLRRFLPLTARARARKPPSHRALPPLVRNAG